MREVCVFLSPSLYRTSTAFIDGLTKNRIAVIQLDAQVNDYQKAVEGHFQRVWSSSKKYQSQKTTPQPRLCIAMEDSPSGIRKALATGMCAIGIHNDAIQRQKLQACGAHASACSIQQLLLHFHVDRYYQMQYLPYAIHLKRLAESKTGYPVSLLDTLSGHFHKGIKVDENNSNTVTASDTFTLDDDGPRVIPRQILGIRPDSLADVYINNIGWPQDKIGTFFLDTHELEMDIIRMFGRFFECPDGLLRGYVTTGGTEGNFSGLWWNRDYLRQATGQEPLLLASNQSHYSIGKASQQLSIQGKLISTGHYGDIDCGDLAHVLDQIASSQPECPILMVVTLGTTQTGAMDDLPRIYDLLLEKVQRRGQSFAIHVDAALMGACLPIRKPFGDVNLFQDFGVNTMAISGHKFFGSVTICGLCLAKSSLFDSCYRSRNVGVGYLTGLHDMTSSGSRSGFVTISLHNTLCALYMHTDCRRLRLLVLQCYKNVEYFYREVVDIVGTERVLHPPHSLTVCFPRPSPSLMSRYLLMPVTLPPGHSIKEAMAGVCVLVNVDRSKMDRFLDEYRQHITRAKTSNSSC
jgi:histidine decarboxylase